MSISQQKDVPVIWAVVLLLLTALFGYVFASHGTSAAVTFEPSTGPVLTQLPLTTLFRLKTGFDYFTDFRQLTNYDSEGAIFYVPTNAQAGSQLLKRWISSYNSEHMDYFSQPSGYNDDLVSLGYPWPNQEAGTEAIRAMWKLSAGDHATIHSSEISAFQGLGYSLDGYSLGFGYPRYNSVAESLLKVPATTTTGITVYSNRVAGGSVWRLYWPTESSANQYVNIHDYGRQIQTALFYHFDGGDYNPTEAGDGCSGPVLTPGRTVAEYHGSPLLTSYDNVSPEPGGGWRQVTRSIPLEFPRCGPPPGDGNTPILYPGVELGKDIVVNYKNRTNVAKYSTWIKLPVAITGVALAIPTLILRANYNRAYGYDAITHSYLALSTSLSCPQYTPAIYPAPQPSLQNWKAGGIILEDPTTQRSIGLLGASISAGGAVDQFEFADFRCNNDGSSETAGDAVQMTAFYGSIDWQNPSNYGRRRALPSGPSTFNTFIVTGSSVGQVGQTMTDVCHEEYPNLCP